MHCLGQMALVADTHGETGITLNHSQQECSSSDSLIGTEFLHSGSVYNRKFHVTETDFTEQHPQRPQGTLATMSGRRN